MWITVGIISVVIFVLVVLWLVNSRPKAMNAEERIEQLGYKYEVNPARLQTQMNASGQRRKRTIEEIKKDILREQELEEARKEQ